MFRWFNREISPSIAAIIRLMDMYPEQWTITEHYARHSGGCEIWLHYDWTLKVDVPGVGRIMSQSDTCRATRDQKALWKAIKNLKNKGNANIAAYVRQAEETAAQYRQQILAQAFANDHEKIHERLIN